MLARLTLASVYSADRQFGDMGGASWATAGPFCWAELAGGRPTQGVAAPYSPHGRWAGCSRSSIRNSPCSEAMHGFGHSHIAGLCASRARLGWCGV